MKLATIDQLLADRDARRPAALLRWLATGRVRLIHTAAEALDPVLADAVTEAFASDRARSVDTEAGDVFVQPFNPPLRMAIVGAVHIAQHLAPMATSLSYAVTVIDPRSAFATPERFPAVALSHEWPDRALQSLDIDARTAVVTLSHDPKLDDPALLAALDSQAFYIGSLGSRGNHTRRMARLREHGWNEAALNRIHGPVGLAIGARSPAEIAVSILAEVTHSLHERHA